MSITAMISEIEKEEKSLTCISPDNLTDKEENHNNLLDAYNKLKSIFEAYINILKGTKDRRSRKEIQKKLKNIAKVETEIYDRWSSVKEKIEEKYSTDLFKTYMERLERDYADKLIGLKKPMDDYNLTERYEFAFLHYCMAVDIHDKMTSGFGGRSMSKIEKLNYYNGFSQLTDTAAQYGINFLGFASRSMENCTESINGNLMRTFVSRTVKTGDELKNMKKIVGYFYSKMGDL